MFFRINLVKHVRHVNSRVAITLVRSTHHCIRGGRGSVLPYQCDTSPVGGQCGTTFLPVRLLARPVLISLPYPLSFPPPSRGKRCAGHWGPHRRLVFVPAMARPRITGGWVLPHLNPRDLHSLERTKIKILIIICF